MYVEIKYCYALEEENSRSSVTHSLHALSLANMLLVEMKWCSISHSRENFHVPVFGDSEKHTGSGVTIYIIYLV